MEQRGSASFGQGFPRSQGNSLQTDLARPGRLNPKAVGAGFHVIIGSPPAPGGPVAIAFPFIIIEDNNDRGQRSDVRGQTSDVRGSVNVTDKVGYRMRWRAMKKLKMIPELSGALRISSDF